MNAYSSNSIGERLLCNSYVGRGIVIGKTPDLKKAVVAYFIMGRSANSRNRVFVENGDALCARAFDEAKLKDPTLIIYTAMRSYENKLIVTNGDHTDTIYEFLKAGRSFEDALSTREFEPDAPNYTPRISGLLSFCGTDFSYKLSILKSGDSDGSVCDRCTFSYTAVGGRGHFIHTYACDGDPLPPFVGEPERVTVPDDIDRFTSELWNSLDSHNKISLYVRYVDIQRGNYQCRLVNRNQ